jgi:hypothetical protein
LKSLWAEKTTPSDIANQLNIPESELSDLLCGVLNTPVPTQPTEIKDFSIVSVQA